MFKQVIKPSEILKKYINYYYVLETDSLTEFSEKLRVYPYGNIILVFHYNHPFLFQKRDKPAELEPRTVICGQQTTYYDLTPAGKTGMIFVVFQPYGAGMFFKIPMNEITDKNIAFEHIAKMEACEIEDKIQNAYSIEDRICFIDNYLVKKFIQNHYDGEQIIHAFHKINKRKGEISVKKLADTACLSIKQFQRKFSGLVGVNPKQYLRTVRFQNVLQIKKSSHFLDYTSLAMECGYFDQSHFINDFKSITGLSPKNFFKENQPSL